jgi:hypothetical protein
MKSVSFFLLNLSCGDFQWIFILNQRLLSVHLSFSELWVFHTGIILPKSGIQISGLPTEVYVAKLGLSLF